MDFKKMNGLVPVIVQDDITMKVLMLGYMNEEALKKTKDSGEVTFFSRSKDRLWTKGETSGNKLIVKDILEDCDNDALLIKATPTGPVCHTGADTCFSEGNTDNLNFINYLSGVIHHRYKNPKSESYTTSLFQEGVNRIAQKVGEEAVELVIEATNGTEAKFKEEAADLIYHLLVLLQQKEMRIQDVLEILKNRHSPS
jgi:phosphoribosyl-ATP pyrophosphohydrolase/phosphoribosyl-AMP cyclohydrolase